MKILRSCMCGFLKNSVEISYDDQRVLGEVKQWYPSMKPATMSLHLTATQRLSLPSKLCRYDRALSKIQYDEIINDESSRERQ